MAIDTAEKRRSITGIPFLIIPGVTPNVSKDQEWRQESGWSYSGILAAAPPVADPGFCVVEYYSGSWINITADVVMETLNWGGGIRGAGPFERVATPGTCEFELKNSTNNSGSLLGYYSPDHANLRSGWKIGAKIRITLDDDTDTLIWVYRIKSIRPVPGQYGPRRVEVTALDYMEEFAKRKVSGLAIQTSKRGNELLTALVASMPIAPTATSYGTGAFILPYAFHTERDEETQCLTVAQKISQSELSYIYVAPDATTGEVLTYEPHTTRANNSTSAGTLTNTMQDLSIEHSADNIINKARATTYPVEIDTDISVLASISETFALHGGETRTIFIPYIDPTSERRISGSNIIVPVLGTDINAEITPGSGINDGNVFLGPDATAGANAVLVELEHLTPGGAIIYVYQLQVRGYAVRTFDKVESVQSDATSLTTYGESTETYNMPYQNSAVFGDAVADEIVRRYKDPLTQVSSVTFITSSATLQTYALTLTIGDRITLTETITGTSDPFYINAADYELLPGDRLRVTWELERAFNDARYFFVGDATYGLVGSVYTLAPF